MTYSSANFSLSNASSLSHSFSEDLKVRVSKKGNEIQKKGGHLRWKLLVMMRCCCNVVWLRFSAVWQLLLQRMTRCVLWVLYAQFIISYVLHWGCGLFPPFEMRLKRGGKSKQSNIIVEFLPKPMIARRHIWVRWTTFKKTLVELATFKSMAMAQQGFETMNPNQRCPMNHECRTCGKTFTLLLQCFYFLCSVTDLDIV